MLYKEENYGIVMTLTAWKRVSCGVNMHDCT